MEQNLNEQIISSSPTPLVSNICPFCHQPVAPQAYFCSNCGTKINEAPLSTTLLTQIWIYTLSIILPMFLFIFVTKWPGMKYIKSNDPKTKQIGQIAWALIIISTILTVWLTSVLTQKMIDISLNSIGGL